MKLAGFSKCLADYRTQFRSPFSGLLTALVLSKSVARWCNITPFFSKDGVIYTHVRRKDVVPLHLIILVIWCNFKRFNNILNSKILMNLIRKRKYLADQLQLCFCFCISNTKYLYFIFALELYNLLHGLIDRVFDYDLYWRTRACLLCIPVPPSTVPIHYVVYSGYFHWTLSLFIYVRSMSGLSCPCCRWPE